MILLIQLYAAAVLPLAAAGETVDVVTDAQMWALVVGFASPLLIAVVQQPTWSGRRRTLVTVAWSLVATIGTTYFAGELSGRGLVSCYLVIVVSAIATDQSLGRPLRVAGWIESKTSRGDSTVQVVTDLGNTEKVVVDRPPRPRR